MRLKKSRGTSDGIELKTPNLSFQRTWLFSTSPTSLTALVSFEISNFLTRGSTRSTMLTSHEVEEDSMSDGRDWWGSWRLQNYVSSKFGFSQLLRRLLQAWYSFAKQRSVLAKQPASNPVCTSFSHSICIFIPLLQILLDRNSTLNAICRLFLFLDVLNRLEREDQSTSAAAGIESIQTMQFFPFCLQCTHTSSVRPKSSVGHSLCSCLKCGYSSSGR